MTDAALSLAVNDVIDGFTVVRVLGSEHIFSHQAIDQGLERLQMTR